MNTKINIKMLLVSLLIIFFISGCSTSFYSNLKYESTERLGEEYILTFKNKVGEKINFRSSDNHELSKNVKYKVEYFKSRNDFTIYKIQLYNESSPDS